MATSMVPLFTILLVLPLSVFCDEPVKMCVPEKLGEACQQMANDLPDKYSCVIARDWVDCAHRLLQGTADLANMDTRGIYVAGRYFDIVPIATEIIDGGPSQYEGVALIAKGSDIQSPEDLRGRKSCHTGVGRTVGWQLPLAQLASKGILEAHTCAAGAQGSVDFLASVENFFSGGSCAPGSWSSDPLVDKELKARYPGLCSVCKDPVACSGNDPYAGYEGVVRCLTDGAGDVAFTKISIVKKFLNDDPSFADKVELLCPNGGKMELTVDGEGLDNCYWGFRPTNAFLTSADNNRLNGERLLAVIAETQALYTPARVRTPEWYHKTFFSSPKVNAAQPVGPDRDNYRSYLEDFLYAIESPECQQEEVTSTTWCVVSEPEQRKCEDYARAASSRSLSPEINCVLATSKAACMELLKNGHANVVTLDGGDVYKAGRYYNLLPVTAEVYGESDATYYAVAVLRSASDVSKLSDLRGLRSCHTGMGRTAGWVVPVGSLIRDGSLEQDQCDRAAGVADFFTSGSCVPGANDTKYNPGRSHADKLCQQCVGNDEGNFKCARDSKERYSGYAGALRCLAEGRGDVAFVKHTTVPQYTDGHSTDEWARDLLSSDFQLLCGEGGNAPVQNYINCSLAKVPSHYVMTNGNATPEDRLKLAKLLADSSRLYGDDSSLFRLFDLYGPGDGQQDLLFKDSTTSLKSISITSSYIDAIGQDFYYASAAVDPKTCNVARR